MQSHPIVNVNLTGFGAFQGLKTNPTEIFARQFVEYLDHKQFVNPNWSLSSVHVIPVVPYHSLADLLHIFQEAECSVPSLDEALNGIAFSMMPETESQNTNFIYEYHRPQKTPSPVVLFIHMGLYDALTDCVHFETLARNEAEFPIRLGSHTQAYCGPILPVSSSIPTQFPNLVLPDQIENVTILPSTDCGTYLCNWLFFHSLRFSLQQTEKQAFSCFIHVPNEHNLPTTKLNIIICELINIISAECLRITTSSSQA
ncbi:putative pyroglutamyl-peptidase [Blattamonas nauphoetae]|uniref:Pyroglutamyl-peptidase n=1 Tax=Blattamonas nauphoetae TaxID=2049346 RepID=A0ABQ9Y3J3_9EUKA|nr:putative pyroglutamyl-peptidase [Blattamonas nauphoetae]